jgi:hypothetical protein
MKKPNLRSSVSKQGKDSCGAAAQDTQQTAPHSAPHSAVQSAPQSAHQSAHPSADMPEEVSVLRSSTSLSPEQCLALKNLMSGQSMSQAAMGAGVCRTTLYYWMNQDPEFRAAHNAWKRDTFDSAHSSVLALTEPAIRAVAAALEAGDAKTGLSILKSLGLLSRPEPGSTSADDVRTEQRIEQKKQEKKLRNAEDDADFPV